MYRVRAMAEGGATSTLTGCMSVESACTDATTRQLSDRSFVIPGAGQTVETLFDDDRDYISGAAEGCTYTYSIVMASSSVVPNYYEF